MKSLAPSLFLTLGACFTSLAGNADSPFTISPSLAASNGIARVHVHFAVPPRHFLYADKLSFEIADQKEQPAFTLPRPDLQSDNFSKQPKPVFNRSFTAAAELAEATLTNIVLTVHYQGCDEANCYFPETRVYRLANNGLVSELNADEEPAVSQSSGEWRRLAEEFTITASGSGYLNEKALSELLTNAQTGASLEVDARVSGGGWFVLAQVLLFLFGGLALNLTPCVLPLIPIDLAILGVGAQANTRKRGFALGASYGLGMAFAYGALGVVVVLTGSKFGTLNSSPWFNFAIAAIFVALAFAMFGKIQIDFSRFQGRGPRWPGKVQGKFLLAGVMGAVAALLAGACVAPVVISAFLQATSLYNRGFVIGLALPFALGIGMALPWPFAGAGLSFLPKPGKWMMQVRHGFAVIILIYAAYYGHLAVGLATPVYRAVDRETTQAGAAGSETLGKKLADVLSKALTQRKPVFIDFWATWCKSCSVMEYTTFRNPGVQRQLKNFLQVKLQVEHPTEPSAKELLDYFRAFGLPTYVVIVPRDKSSGTERTRGNPAGARD